MFTQSLSRRLGGENRDLSFFIMIRGFFLFEALRWGPGNGVFVLALSGFLLLSVTYRKISNNWPMCYEVELEFETGKNRNWGMSNDFESKKRKIRSTNQQTLPLTPTSTHHQKIDYDYDTRSI